MRPTVLLVDDERLVTEAMKRALRKEAFEVLTAGSGAQALKILAGQRVDVVVADEKMPGMSGSELLRIVHVTYPDTIRMILTGYATLEKAMQAINQCDIHRFFTKPCEDRELAKALREAITQKRLDQDARDVAHILKSGTDPDDCLVPPGA